MPPGQSAKIVTVVLSCYIITSMSQSCSSMQMCSVVLSIGILILEFGVLDRHATLASYLFLYLFILFLLIMHYLVLTSMY